MTIAIIGSTPEAALAAAYIGTKLGSGFDIHWARGEEGLGPLPVRTGPLIHSILGALGQTEQSFVAHGGYSLGSAVSVPGRPPFFLGHGDQPSSISGIPFYQVLQSVRGTKCAPAPQHYSLAAIMAGNGGFRYPTEDPNVPGGAFGYGLIVDPDYWFQHCAEIAAQAGVKSADSKAADNADFIINARAHPDDAQEWHSFGGEPITVNIDVESGEGRPPYLFTAIKPDCVESTYRMGAQTIRRRLSRSAKGKTFGRLASPWSGNRIAIGPAASFLPGIFPQSFDMLIHQLRRIVELAPADCEAVQERKEYNRRVCDEIDRTFDAEALFLPAPLATPRSPELERKIEQFGYRGRITIDDGDMFTEEEWVALLDYRFGGPEFVDARTSRLPQSSLVALLNGIRNRMINVAQTAPKHEEVVARLREELSAPEPLP